MSSIHRFESVILQSWPASKWSNMTVLIACSGGADSTALFRSLMNVKQDSTTIVIAHFNHKLRGKDSDDDQAFVQSLAEQLRIRCEVAFNADSNSSSEDSLRNQRYEFLEQVALKIGARYVVTAHTADDQVETILHRLCRGTGPSGLTGISMFRDFGSQLVLARPMLNLWRTDVENYLRDINQAYRIDASNQSDGYTRNRIRNAVIPVLESAVNSEAKKRILESSQSIAEIVDWLSAQAKSFINAHVRIEGTAVVIDRTHLRRLNVAVGKAVLREVWSQQDWPERDMSKDHWERMWLEVTSENNAKFDFPSSISFVAKDNEVRLQR
jgi:tRNA(Ile)-lysidine synthase